MKVAIITGANGGIGCAIASHLSKAGYQLVLNYNNRRQDIDALLPNLEGEPLVLKGDISKQEDAYALVDQAYEQFGRIDLLINNAGITKDGLLVRMSEEDFDTVYRVNLKGTYNCTKAVTKRMMKQRYGKIINITSVIGIIGNAGQSNYAASKAGVIGFTKSIAKELAPRHITVNAIAPGFIASPMTDQLEDHYQQQILDKIPLKRFGQTNEIASLVTYLSSEAADYITGQVITIDGGLAI